MQLKEVCSQVVLRSPTLVPVCYCQELVPWHGHVNPSAKACMLQLQQDFQAFGQIGITIQCCAADKYIEMKVHACADHATINWVLF